MNRKQRRAGGKNPPSPARPPLTAALLAEAVSHHQAGRLGEAERLYRLILSADARHADALHLLGVVAFQSGRHPLAAELIAKAIGINRRIAAYHSNLGNALKEIGRLDEAVAAYRMALRLQPAYPEAHYNLGGALLALGHRAAALGAFRQALGDWPGRGDAIANLGVALREEGLTDQAISAGRASLCLDPADAEVHYNLGVALRERGAPEPAIEAYRRATRLRPDFAQAHLNQAFILLQRGDYPAGWAEYEWRAEAEGQRRENVAQPQWQGQPLERRRILLHPEQGLGDCIQFSRFAPLVAERGGRVILEVPPALAGLMAGLEGVAELVVQGEALPDYDLHCPLMSLPRLFDTRIETIPAPVPYLRADAERTAFWRREIGEEGVKIGIAWQGNPGFRDDRRRSVPLAAFAPLARRPGVRLISLQKVHGLDQLDRLPPGMTVERLGRRYDEGDFAETAAVMMGLDLIVSSCTSVPHLAGALGRPTWLALGPAPYWAWLEGRDDSPWYPTLRLFRQKTPGDWESVFEAMVAADAAYFDVGEDA